MVKKLLSSVAGAVLAMTTMAETETITSLSATTTKELVDGFTYTFSGDVNVTMNATLSALKVADGATVTLNIPRGVIVSLTGGDANGTTGAGAVGSMPWAESPAGIAMLIKSEGVTGLEELVGSLPDLTTVNGLTLEDFGGAIRGFVRSDGFSAIEIESGEAKLDVVIGRSDSLEEPAEWTPVSTNSVVVPAPGEQGFFIVVPTVPSDGAPCRFFKFGLQRIKE